MIDNKKVGECISTLRKEQNLTQKQLAERLNISPQAVSKWENGLALPDTVLLVELAKLLQITVDDLLQGERKATVSKKYTSTKENITAQEILEEIRSGKDIYIRDAIIEGDLIFVNPKSEGEMSRFPFIRKFTSFVLKYFNVGAETEVIQVMEGQICFENCIFLGKIVDFVQLERNTRYQATFNNKVAFLNCQFKQEVTFKHSTFNQYTSFEKSMFHEQANYKFTSFSREASFHSSIFQREADFKYTNFDDMVSFQNGQFQSNVTFKYVTCRNIQFEHVFFHGEADFKYAKFPKKITFGNSIFQSAADFKYAKISRDSLDDVTFKGTTDFKYTSYV